MPFFLIFTIGLLLAPILTQAIDRKNMQRHFVFLIHGLNGSVATFGDLPLVLKKHGQIIQPDTDLQVIPLNYSTGRDDQTTYDFARQIGNQIVQHIGELRSSDRITLVAHSQGGVVSWIFLLKSLDGDDGFEFFKPYAAQTEGLMTLGSPIWGSKLADFASDNDYLRGFAKKFGVKLGRREVEEMSYLSDTIVRFSRRASLLEDQGVHLPFRVQSVAGIVSEANDKNLPISVRARLLAFQTFYGLGWNKLAETDLAVPIASARANFIHQKNPQSSRKNRIFADEFSVFEDPSINDLTIIRGIHASRNPEKQYDIAHVPLECINLKQACNHPTYGLILQFAMKCSSSIQGCKSDEFNRLTNHFLHSDGFLARTKINGEPILEQMHSFTVNLITDMPEDFQMPTDAEDIEKYLSFASAPTDSITQLNYQEVMNFKNEGPGYYFILDRGMEIDSLVTRVSDHYADYTLATDPRALGASSKQLRFAIQGQVYAKDGQLATFKKFLKDGFKLPLTLKIPGHPERKVEALVKPTYSTFVNLDFR